MSGFEDHLAADARLVILRELAKMPDNRLNEAVLDRVLDAFGYRRSREWLRSQLLKLADIGAVETKEAGSVVIATITRAGLDHVERRAFLDGVARPRPE